MTRINCAKCQTLIDRPFKYILGNDYFCKNCEIVLKKNKIKKEFDIKNGNLQNSDEKKRICFYCMKPISSFMYNTHLEICKLTQIEENKKEKNKIIKKKSLRRKKSLIKKNSSKNLDNPKRKITSKKIKPKNKPIPKKLLKEYNEIKKISISKDVQKNLKIKC